MIHYSEREARRRHRVPIIELNQPFDRLDCVLEVGFHGSEFGFELLALTLQNGELVTPLSNLAAKHFYSELFSGATFMYVFP